MSDKHMSVAFRRYVDDTRGRSQTLLERLLHFIGGDAGYADDILGDLAEERARRAERDGARSASLWYVREAMIAVPHLAWNAIHHGGPRGAARVTALVAGAAFAVTMGVVLLRSFSFGPTPARLEIDGQRGARATSGTIIVNTRRPVFLSTRALDARGQPMKSTEVRYKRIGGAPVSVSASGVVTCAKEGDAIIQAALRRTTGKVRIKCRPVHELRTPARIVLTAGQPPRLLPFFALDPDGVGVEDLAGELRVKDSSIVILKEGVLYPQSPGTTEITIRIGDGVTRAPITVLPAALPSAPLRP